MKELREIHALCFPEVAAGGFTSVDGTIQFYQRVNALLLPTMRVLDFGAGRAHWFHDDPCDYRRNLRLLRGKVDRVVACDVDPAVLDNPAIDEGVVIGEGSSLPFPDGTFDLILSDYTFEHIRSPGLITRELSRVVKPGGWICARTPNKYGLVSLLTRLIRNKWHARLLKAVQPTRQSIDVFPTAFQLNTLSAVRCHFEDASFLNCSYRWDAEPAYFFHRAVLFSWLVQLNRVLPRAMSSNLFIFLQKR